MNRTPWSLALACSALAALAWVAPEPAHAENGEAGVEFRYGSININNPLFGLIVGDDDISLIGIDLYARTEVSPGLSIGGRLPVAHAQFDQDAQTTLGNATVELQYRLSADLHSRSWLQTSLSIATADDDGEGAQVAGVFAAYYIPDPGRYLANTNTVRLMYRHEWNMRRNSHANRGLALDFEGGAQFLIIDGAEDRFRIPLRVAGRLGLSAQAEAMARFGTYWTSGAEDGEDDFFHVLEAGIHLAGVGRGSLEILAYIPLDELYRDTLEVWGLSLGFRAPF